MYVLHCQIVAMVHNKRSQALTRHSWEQRQRISNSFNSHLEGILQGIKRKTMKHVHVFGGQVDAQPTGYKQTC